MAPGSVVGEGQSWGRVAGLLLRIRPGPFLPVAATPGEGHTGLCGMRLAHVRRKAQGLQKARVVATAVSCPGLTQPPSLSGLPVVPSERRDCPQPALLSSSAISLMPWFSALGSRSEKTRMPVPYRTDSESPEVESRVGRSPSKPLLP